MGKVPLMNKNALCYACRGRKFRGTTSVYCQFDSLIGNDVPSPVTEGIRLSLLTRCTAALEQGTPVVRLFSLRLPG